MHSHTIKRVQLHIQLAEFNAWWKRDWKAALTQEVLLTFSLPQTAAFDHKTPSPLVLGRRSSLEKCCVLALVLMKPRWLPLCRKAALMVAASLSIIAVRERREKEERSEYVTEIAAFVGNSTNESLAWDSLAFQIIVVQGVFLWVWKFVRRSWKTLESTMNHQHLEMFNFGANFGSSRSITQQLS